MKRIITFLYLVFIVNLVAFSQRDPQFTNNMHYKLGVNPGFAGAENAISGLMLNRYQWVGFDGAPETLVFSVDAAINAFGSPGGVGLNIISDKTGFMNTTNINLNYAYKTSLSFGNLGIGVSFGIYNEGYKNAEWRTSEDVLNGTDGGQDPGVPQGEASQIAFDGGLGLYLSTNQYYLGASVTHINQAEIKFDEIATTFIARHYYLMGGYNIKLSDPLFELQPSFLLKSDIASWQLDINANIVFDEKFWGGISYRIQDAVSLLMGMEMDNGLKVGGSFDLVTSSWRYYGYGSYEFFVSYSIDLERNRSQKYKSVRFL